MRLYQIRVTIENADRGPVQHCELLLPKVNAESIEEVQAMFTKKEAQDAEADSDEPSDDPANH